MTSLFGGVDLGTPAQRNERTMRLAFEQDRKLWQPLGLLYAGPGDYLLKHGRFYQGRLCPDHYLHLETGEQGTCWSTAIEACRADPSLRWCTGVYAHGEGVFVAHAWCVDPDDEVVELTFPTHRWRDALYHDTKMAWMAPETWAYFGVVMDWRLAEAHQEKHGMGPLGRTQAELTHATGVGELYQPVEHLPLLTVPYDRTRVDLP